MRPCIWLNRSWHIGTQCNYFKYHYCYWLSHSFLFLLHLIPLVSPCSTVNASLLSAQAPKVATSCLYPSHSFLIWEKSLNTASDKPWNQSFEMRISIILIFILENWGLREGKPNSQDHTAGKYLKYLNCDSNQINLILITLFFEVQSLYDMTLCL